MKKINKVNYNLTTVTNVAIGSSSELLNNVDFHLTDDSIALKSTGNKIKVDEILFDKKGTLDMLSDYSFEETYNELDDIYLKDYYVFKLNSNKKNDDKKKYILVTEKDIVDFKGEIPGNINFIEEKNKLKLVNIRSKNYSFMYYDNTLSNPVATLPYNGNRYYIPGSSLKGALLSNYSKEELNNNSYDRIIFDDIEVDFENLIISSPYLIQDNKIIQKKEEENSDKDYRKIRKNINTSNNVMFITKNTNFDLYLNDKINNLLKSKARTKENINKQTITKLNNVIKFIKDYLIGNCKEYEKWLIKEKNKLTEFQKENLKNDLLKIIEKLESYKNTISNDKNAYYFFIGNNKKLILSVNKMSSIKDSGLAFDKDYDIFGLVKLERVD